MPSIFDLFGELNLESGAFISSVKTADDKLLSLQKDLSNTESASLRLGDASATVGRRYEKLNEQISFQKERIAQATAAFQSGDINAKKFAATLNSVETQTRSLSSRLEDAKARIREIDQTGLSHFQNQIKGAVSDVDNLEKKGHAPLFNLSGTRPFQGLGPVFQATGLRSLGIDETIANVLVVAAREMGIIKTTTIEAAAATEAISDATKSAAASASVFEASSEASAVSTRAAAVAEAETAAAAQAAATAEGEFASAAGVAAAETEAVAAAATEASTITTILGATLGSLAITIGASLAALFIVYKVTKDIRAEAEKRLKVEEAIAGAMNKQIIGSKAIIDNFKKQLEQESQGRDFDRFLKGSSVDELTKRRDELQKLHDLGAGVVQFQGPTSDAAKASKLQEQQISGINAQIDALKQLEAAEPGKSFDNIASSQIKGQEDARKAVEAAQKAAREELDKTIKKLDELQQKALAGLTDVANVFRKENPVANAMIAGAEAVGKLKEELKGLPPSFIASQVAILQAATAADVFGAKITAALNANNLRESAESLRRVSKIDDFRRTSNSTNPDALRQVFGGASDAERVDKAVLATSGAQSDAEQAKADEALTNMAKNIDPRKLRSDQRELIAQAFDRQADRQDKFFTDAPGLLKEISANTAFVKNFYDNKKTDAKSGTKVDIFLKDDTSDKKATNATVATEGDVAQTYDVGFFNGRNN